LSAGQTGTEMSPRPGTLFELSNEGKLPALAGSQVTFARILDISHMISRLEGRIHCGNSNSEPGMVKAWHLEPYGMPPSGLMLRVY